MGILRLKVKRLWDISVGPDLTTCRIYHHLIPQLKFINQQSEGVEIEIFKTLRVSDLSNGPTLSLIVITYFGNCNCPRIKAKNSGT